MENVLIILAEGFEEIEAVTVIDVLRRAEISVTVAGLNGNWVKGAHGILIEADIPLPSLPATETFAMLVLPGGEPGTTHLQQSPRITELIQKQVEQGSWVAAICAAPRILAEGGFLKGLKATSFPKAREQMKDCHYLELDVVVDGRWVTSRGPGTAMSFALTLVGLLKGDQKADEVAGQMLAPKTRQHPFPLKL